jgi:hypothetical protein
MNQSKDISPQLRRAWYRISSSWWSDFLELTPKLRWRQLESRLNTLGDKLNQLGYEAPLINGLSLWIIESLEDITTHKWHVKPVRVLHHMEREYITPEAYGLFLEALQTGIMTPEDSEKFLEKLASKHHLPIEIHQLEDGLASFWLKKIKLYKPQ